MALAETLAHPFTLARARLHASVVYQYCREAHRVREVASALIDLSAEHGFVQDLAAAKILYGWGVASKGQSEEGIAQMLEGLADYAATGAAARNPPRPAPTARPAAGC